MSAVFSAVFGEFMVMNGPTLFPLFLPEVTHTGEEKGQADFMAPDVGGFLHIFGHPQGILVGVEVIKNSGFRIKLVA